MSSRQRRGFPEHAGLYGTDKGAGLSGDFQRRGPPINRARYLPVALSRSGSTSAVWLELEKSGHPIGLMRDRAFDQCLVL